MSANLVTVDVGTLRKRFDFTPKQWLYIGVNAVNNTAKRIQAAQREHVRREFTLRKPEFVLRQAAIIKPFASVSQGRPFAEISVGQKPRLLLSAYEKGGRRRPIKGRTRIAVPAIGGPARPTFPQPVPTAYRFTALKLTKTRPKSGTTKSGRPRRSRAAKGVRYGLLGTYQVDHVGVFQRRPGEERSHLIYPFITDEQLPADLHFIRNARLVARRYLKEEVQRGLIDALVHQRRRAS